MCGLLFGQVEKTTPMRLPFNQSRQKKQPLAQPQKSRRGSGRGESPFLQLNIHLPLSPSANSPLGRRGTRMPRRLSAARVDDPSTRESGLCA